MERKECEMRKLMMALLGLTLILGASAPTYAAGSGVLVVYNGNSQVNRETYNFVRRNLSQQGVSANVTATQDLKSIKAGTYQAILVLSTGTASGLDPALKAFVDSYSAKKELFIVSLLQNSSSMTLANTKVSDVDVVTAASKWSEGSDKMTYINLHAGWVKEFADFLKAKA